MLVLVPVLLMLGSVYLHTVSTDLGAQASGLEEKLARAEARGEKLRVQVSELSAPGRIRELAEEDLGMKVPSGVDLEVYGNDGEDGRQNGGEKAGERSP